MSTIDADMSSLTDNEEKEEILHFMRVLNAFKDYRHSALRALKLCEENYLSLSDEHKAMIPDHLKVLQDMKICIDFNAAVMKEITNFCSGMFENKKYQKISEHVPFTSIDSDKVKSTLKQIARDWSLGGAEERRLCYEPMISEITSRLPISNKESSGPEKQIKVLVPGCGLGRLPWEFAKRGYCCQGNEFSFFMLFTSYFIINRTQSDGENDFHQYTIYPWVGKRCNNLSWNDVLKPVKFPDVNPNSIPPNNLFSMAAGDFLEIYTEEGSWDCVACCFFIDTANNIITYIERIFHVLKPGGLFVNLGPLLYHYSGMAKEKSIELSYEEVLEVIKKVGFFILKEELVKGLYTNLTPSMLNYEYTCALVVAQKPKNATVPQGLDSAQESKEAS